MKLSTTQFATLRWLSDIGGTCIPFGEKVAHPWFAQPPKARKGQQEPREAAYKMPAVSALHLVALGCIEAAGGQLRITDKGRAVLSPFKRDAA